MIKQIMVKICSGILLSALPILALATSNDAMAKQTIENWFADMKANKIAAAKNVMSPQFQSEHTDSIARDRDQELKLLKGLQMKNFKLTDFKFTESGDTVVATYLLTTTETIDKQTLHEKKVGRLTILQKQGDQFVILAHANLECMGCK